MEPVRRRAARGRSHMVHPGGGDGVGRSVDATDQRIHVLHPDRQHIADQCLERIFHGQALDITVHKLL